MLKVYFIDIKSKKIFKIRDGFPIANKSIKRYKSDITSMI